MTVFTSRIAAMAATLSLSLVAGCAAPASITAPATVAAPAAQPAAPDAPAAPSAATPVQPAPAAVAPMTLAGTATFRGEPLAGYTVTVLDARTGKPVATTADLASASGLAVMNQNLATDAKGAFSLQLVGLSAGQVLRVQVSRGDVALEAIVGSNLQAFGASGYRVQAVGGTITVDERSTAIAQIAAGVLLTTALLSPEAAAAVIAKLATRLAALSAELDAPLKAAPSTANALVSTKAGEAASAVKSLVTNAGAAKSLTEAIAALIGEIAKAAPQSPPSEEIKAALAKVEFVGTELTGGLGDGGLTLANSQSGAFVLAATGDLATVSTQKKPSRGSNGTPAPQLAAIPTDPGVTVYTHAELAQALFVQHRTAVTLGADIETAYLGEGAMGPGVMEDAVIETPQNFVIHGAGHRIHGEWSLQFRVHAATFENMTVSTHLDIKSVDAGQDVRLDHVAFEADAPGTYGTVELFGPSSWTVTSCQFNGTGLDEYGSCLFIERDAPVTDDLATYVPSPVLVYKSTFTTSGMGKGLEMYELQQTTIRENTFTNCDPALEIEVADYDTVPDFSGTTILGNTFNALNAQSYSSIYIGFAGVDSDTLEETAYGTLLRRITGNTFNNGQFALSYQSTRDTLTNAKAYFATHNTMNGVGAPVADVEITSDD